MIEKIVIGILFIIWMIFTIILTCSLIGLILLFPAGYKSKKKSTWMRLGKYLVKEIVK